MDRRTAIAGISAIAAAAISSAQAAEKKDKMDHSHHHHHGPAKNQALMDATSACIGAGERCLAHCLVLMGDGDKSMAECARNVNQMLATCRALQSLAAQNSARLKQMAKLAGEACASCEQACKKHADKHQECKDCMESCAACAKECKKAAA
jgi:Cys-rich four helix bundle protein (predicted Tat secretion target)